ncbi:Sucrose operon repressor ScrR, LacI family [Limosilactobacillus fermentum]|nr:Sucrose operon repressor ScrR, LacI family [Limosilactobacillus fermentum]SJM52182.1 Sucrose operon repressor ScrR, LacI family [Limosilactobacillus fermentum]
MLANQVDGIISSSHNLDNEHYQRLAVPIVSFAHQLAEGIPVVTVDSYSGGRMTAAYLREQGAKEVALVLDEAHSPMSSRCRIDGIVDGLARRGNALAVIELDELIRKPLLLNQYDGLIAPNDEVAVQLQGMARASGRKINEDFWVTGYNGSRLMQRLNPELATVVLPVQELADKLIATLLEQIAHPDQVIESPAPVPVRLRRPT